MTQDRILVGIPTKGRPEYLSTLLATLMYQTEEKWDLMIVDTDPDASACGHPQVDRFADTIVALGHEVYYIDQPTETKSEVAAVNRILMEAKSRGYEFLFKVDDDHTMPPNTLARLKAFLENDKGANVPRVISGLSPWMKPAWPGAIGPESVLDLGEHVGKFMDIWLEENDDAINGFDLHMDNTHFYRWTIPKDYKGPYVRRSKRVHPANFMMRPSSQILWSEIGSSSMYADAIWSLQLQKFLGYELYMDMTVDVWHVAAPHGGVRTTEGDHTKNSGADNLRKEVLIQMLLDFDMSEKGRLE